MQEEEKEFNALMSDYLMGHLSDRDIPHLLTLIKSNKVYQKKYKEQIDLFAKIQVPYFDARKQDNFKALNKRINAKKYKLQIWSNKFNKVAALLALCILSATIGFYLSNSIFSNDSSLRTVQNEFIVPFGSQSKIILPDSTVVWLNSGSILKYDLEFGNKVRKVELLGEGYFEVYKDKKRPFLVIADKLDVKVLGTKFNVRAYSADSLIDVSLISGSVNISNREEDRPLNKTLLPNQQLLFSKQTSKAVISAVNSLKSVEWTSGKLSFVNTSLAEILKSVERRYDVKINIRSNKIYHEFFTGSIKLNQSVPDLLDYIDVDNKFIWEQQGNVITIKEK